MGPRFDTASDAERAWLASCIRDAGRLVAAYSPVDEGRTLDAAVLDRTWAAYLATGDTDTTRVNGVINALGFAWVVATDQFGTEMALLALPGRGDVLVYPTNMVAKRWQTRETDFLVHLFRVVTQQVHDTQANWPALPPQFRKGKDAAPDTAAVDVHSISHPD